MWGIRKNRGRYSQLVSLLCVGLMLVVGTVQAVHMHPDNEKAPRHTCSICSTPNAKLNTAHASPVPVMATAPLAIVETAESRIFRPAIAKFVRPPPAA